MIAAARDTHERRSVGILGPNGKPIASRNRVASQLAEVQRLRQARRSISATYDAAETSNWHKSHWSSADMLDADSANSRDVRQVLVRRSRHEVKNNGYLRGILKTYADYFCGTGPKLRMQTGNEPFNGIIELLFGQWCAATGFYQKLWCMTHARVQDGEGIAVVGTNERLKTRVKIDLRVIETEQCQSPQLWQFDSGYVDGIKFDEFDNPEWYDILPSHPGAYGSSLSLDAPERVPAEFVLHWFTCNRPGQHRGVPELASTLNLGAALRRMREATLNAAETAADFSVLLETTGAPDENEYIPPFDTAQLDKGLIAKLPDGTTAKQLAAEHPNAEYSAFIRAGISEMARPLSMPYNLAASDSSQYNFASGKLDQQSFFLGIDVDRGACEISVLDKLFGLWWQEAVMAYSFNSRGDSPPQHVWDFPQHQAADVRAQAIATNLGLRNGSLTLSQHYSNEGYDAEEQIASEAVLLGVPVEQYKQRVFDTLFPQAVQPGADSASLAEQQDQIDQLTQAISALESTA